MIHFFVLYLLLRYSVPEFHFKPEFLITISLFYHSKFITILFLLQIYTSGSEEVALVNRLFGVGERLVLDRVEFVVRCD